MIFLMAVFTILRVAVLVADRVACIAQGFGMDVYAFDPFCPAEAIAAADGSAMPDCVLLRCNGLIMRLSTTSLYVLWYICSMIEPRR